MEQVFVVRITNRQALCPSDPPATLQGGDYFVTVLQLTAMRCGTAELVLTKDTVFQS